jgi:hypothetical protein
MDPTAANDHEGDPPMTDANVSDRGAGPQDTVRGRRTLSDSDLLSSSATASYLGLQPQTLRRWRMAGTGPPYIRLGNSTNSKVAYRRSDLVQWLAERTFAHTAAEAAGSRR